MPPWPPISRSAACDGIAYPNPGSTAISSPPMPGRADGPGWVLHRCCRIIRTARLNAAGAAVTHPGEYPAGAAAFPDPPGGGRPTAVKVGPPARTALPQDMAAGWHLRAG